MSLDNPEKDFLYKSAKFIQKKSPVVASTRLYILFIKYKMSQLFSLSEFLVLVFE